MEVTFVIRVFSDFSENTVKTMDKR